MGDVRHIDANTQEVEETLRLRHNDSSEIDGLILISVYKNGHVTTDISGALSPDPDDLAKLLGRLDLAGKDLYAIATDEEYE